MGADNIFIQYSGANIGTGSHCVTASLLMGMSGTMAYPVMVNELGQLVQISGA